VLILQRPWTEQPQGVVSGGSYHGLRNLYYFGAGQEHCLITGSRMVQPGTSAAVVKRNEYLELNINSNATTGAQLPLNFDCISPLTMLIGFSVQGGGGTRVPFALMSNDWDGWYGEMISGNLVFKSTNNIDFSGEVTPTDGGVKDQHVAFYALTMGGANDLRASMNGGAVALDSACAFPTPNSPNNFLDLGVVSTNAFPVDMRIKYFALLDRPVSDGELISLSSNPWQLFAPRRIYIPTATAASGAPTLSDLKAVSITSSSVQATYDYAF
jgi:hypothetical protein